MVQLWLTFWRAIHQIQENEEHVVLENRGKTHFISLKKKSRRMHVVFALLLAWCLTVLSFFIRRGVPSLPTYYDTVEQVFPVRLLMGWEQAATLEIYPSKKSHHHDRVPADYILKHVHYQADNSSVPNNLSESEAAIKSLPSNSSSISEKKSGRSIGIAQIPFLSVIVNASNSQELIDAIHTQKKNNKMVENLLGKSRDQKALAQLNVTSITESSFDVEKVSDHDGVAERNAKLDLKEHGQLEQKNTESMILNQESATNYTNEGKLSDADNSEQIHEGISCDRSHWRTDICRVEGDVRVKAKSVELHMVEWNERLHVVETVRPYTRKWEMPLMLYIDEMRIENLHAPAFSSNRTNTLICNVKHSVPAIIFSTGGYTGNVYHDFSDGLIPLYITSRHLHGEVVFLVLDFHEWWLRKYGGVIRQLSNYPVVDLRSDPERIQCFPEVTVGLKIHDELAINSDQMANGGSSKDFHTVLQHAFTPPGTLPSHDTLSQKIPKLVLIARTGSRSMSNQDEVIDLVKRVGFQVEVLEPNGGSRLEDIFMLLNSCDVMMGVHGAAMTHLLFMRPGTIFIQIIPLGTDGPAFSFYGNPAMKMGLDYIEYKVKPRESSLSRKYRKNDTVLTNPEEIASKGWLELKKYYLDGQNVRLYLPRLKLTLQKALKRIKRRKLINHSTRQKH